MTGTTIGEASTNGAAAAIAAAGPTAGMIQGMAIAGKLKGATATAETES